MIAVRPVAEVADEPTGAAAIAELEAGFTYPLGGNERFRISYAGAMREFFQAQGEAEAWTAMSGNRCLGLIGASVRDAPAGGPRRIATIGGLKVCRSIAGAMAFAAITRTTSVWLRKRHVQSAFGVVMDGTTHTPDRYTGRLWIPAFRATSALTLLRFRRGNQASAPPHPGHARLVDNFLRLPSVRHELRSARPPLEICEGNGAIRLEDTLRAKRLFRTGIGGAELRAAHLGALHAGDVRTATSLVARGLIAAWETGAECAFLSLPTAWWSVLADTLQQWRPEVFGAQIFAAGAPLPMLWPDTWDI